MNAKQALRDHIERLSEDEAAELLARIDWDATEFEKLTEDELRELRASEEEFARGEYSDGEDVFHRLGL
jgi:hypothetical protein